VEGSPDWACEDFFVSEVTGVAAASVSASWLRLAEGYCCHRDRQQALADHQSVDLADLAKFQESASPMAVWQDWRDEGDVLNAIPRNSLGTVCAEFVKQIQTNGAQEDLGQTRPLVRRFLMIEPNCTRKLLWDLIGLLWMLWDFITIPLAAFGVQDQLFMRIAGILLTIFWSCDILFTFLTGYYDKGKVEMRPRMVAVRYLKTWFFIDAIIVSIDYIVLLFQSSGPDAAGFARIGRSWRVIRVLRIVRLVRVVKAVRLLDEFTDLIRSESIQTVISIVKLLVGVTMVNHLLACAWYAIGTAELTEISWVTSFVASYAEDPDIEYRYLTSLHWSLTQFTPASMEIVPRNKYERLYVIAVIIFALVVFSSFVSSITAAMTHLRKIKEKQTKMQEDLRKFIIDNNISPETSLQVHLFARRHITKHKRVLETDLTFLKYMPENLRIQLHREVYLPATIKHPLFLRASLVDANGMEKVCHTAMAERSLLAGEELFNYGDACQKMYFSMAGGLEYYHHTRDGDEVSVIQGSATDPPRISEVVLWAPWEHRGRLVASTSSYLITIISSKFRTVCKSRVTMKGPIGIYARKYCAGLLNYYGSQEWILDLWDDPQALDEISQDAYEQTGLMAGEDFSYSKAQLKIFHSGVPSSFQHPVFRRLTREF